MKTNAALFLAAVARLVSADGVTGKWLQQDMHRVDLILSY